MTTGNAEQDACVSCRDGLGPFERCIAVEEGCANCVWENAAAECSTGKYQFFDFYYPSLRPKRVYEIKKDVLEGFVAAKAF